MNRKEIHKEIRRISKNHNKCECFICKTQENVQNHHIIKVDTLTNIAYMNGYNTSEKISQMYIPTVDLCEECHKKVHSLMLDNYIEPKIDYKDFLSVIDIIDMVDYKKFPNDLFEDYIEATERLTGTVIFNLLEYGEFTSEELETINEIIEEMERREENDIIRSY